MNKHLEEIQLRSEEVQEVLSNPPSWIVRWGITIISLDFVLLLVASYIIKYPDFITTQITITTLNPPEKIEAKSAGRITNLLVKDQEEVNQNQILAVLENTADYQAILELEKLVENHAKNYKEFTFPTESIQNYNLGEIQEYYALFEKAYTDFLLNKKLRPYTIENNAGKQAISELNSRKKVLELQRKLEQKELVVRKKDLNRTKTLFEEGIISQVEYETKELAYLQAQRNYENTKIAISQIQESKNTANRNIESANLNSIQDDTKFLKEVILSFEQLKRSIKEWKQTYLLIASIDGKVSFQQFWGKNQFVKVGEEVISILPTESNLIGKITTQATNTGKIKPKQKVLIKLDNFPYQEFGIIKGTVKSMSLTPNAEGNYFIEVVLPNELETSYNKKLSFDREMKGSADIVTEDLRLIQRVFYEFRKLFSFE